MSHFLNITPLEYVGMGHSQDGYEANKSATTMMQSCRYGPKSQDCFRRLVKSLPRKATLKVKEDPTSDSVNSVYRDTMTFATANGKSIIQHQNMGIFQLRSRLTLHRPFPGEHSRIQFPLQSAQTATSHLLLADDRQSPPPPILQTARTALQGEGREL